MILKENSITARLYRWFYNQKTMPESLCPYFWKLLFMWVFIIPYSVVVIPVTPIVKEVNTLTMFKRFMVSLSVWLIAYTMICMIAVIPLFFVDKLSNVMEVIGFTGLLGWGLLISIFAVGLVGFIMEKVEDRGYYKQKQDSIIKEFVKAKYSKYCPKITWK